MPHSFTVFNSGTAFDENSGDIIASLGKAMSSSQRGRTFMRCAGPGSSLIGRHNYNPLLPNGIDSAKAQGWISSGMSLLATPVNKGRGLIAGEGMERNSAFLIERLDVRNKPAVINMVGWSRGAITCHLMANDMLKARGLAGITVNIFAIDPVPGTGNFDDWFLGANPYLNVPPNVKNYVAILMEDEGRSYMRAADVKRKPMKKSARQSANFRVYTFPGVHSTGVQPSTKKHEEAVYQLIAHLAEKFLKDHGTHFSQENYIIANNRGICELFAIIRNGFKFNSAPRLIGTEESWRNLKNQTQVYYVNRYHEEVFPVAWGCDVGDLWPINENNPIIAGMKTAYPETYKSLQAFGTFQDETYSYLSSMFD